MVRVLPGTGERSLVLGHFLRRFVGHTQFESEPVVRIAAVVCHPARKHGAVALACWGRGDVG